MPFIFRIGLIATLLNLSGCAFMLWPHKEQIAPLVSGRVLRDGEPVPRVKVLLVESLHGANCATPSKYAAITDNEGRFTVGGERRLALFVVMGDRLDRWSICVGGVGNVVEGLWAGYSRSALQVVCEISRQPNICQRA